MTKLIERRKSERTISNYELNDLLTKDPTNTKVWKQLEEVYLNYHHYENALDCFETVLSLNSKPDDHMFNLVRQSILDGDHEITHCLLTAIKYFCWQDQIKSHSNISVG